MPARKRKKTTRKKAARKKAGGEQRDPTVEQLDDVKRLLMLLLMKLGATGDEIARALRTSPATVTRTIPKRGTKHFSFVDRS